MFIGQEQAILPSSGTPLEECQFTEFGLRGSNQRSGRRRLLGHSSPANLLQELRSISKTLSGQGATMNMLRPSRLLKAMCLMAASPVAAETLECRLFPETEVSSTSAHRSAPTAWIKTQGGLPTEDGFQVLGIETPSQSKEVAGTNFTTEAVIAESCETKPNPYSPKAIIASTCTNEPVFKRTDGKYTMNLTTVNATFFSVGVAADPNYKWRIVENSIILRMEPSDPSTILHVQYVRTSEGYYSCR